MVVRALLVILFTALLTLGVFIQPFYSQVKGLIVGPGAERYPMAVSPLRNIGVAEDKRGLSEGIADTIVYDLNLSGWFRVLDRSAYIEHPQRSGVILGSFDFRDWTTIGAEGLVKGGFSVQGDDLTVELRLFDVYQGTQIVGKRYTGKVRDYRRIAHKFADEIIFQFTGVPGVFNTRIAYVSTGASGLKEIYVSHLDGSEKVQVTSNRTINLSPSWSPDGRALLYTSYKDGNPSLYLYDLTTGKETRLSARAGLNVGGKWSPDGQLIAVSLERGGNTDIYLLDQAGKVVRRLTEEPGIDVSPTWSPDRSHLAFVSNRSGGPQIYIMELASGKARRLTYSGSYNTSPDWSPKGDRIAYIGRVAGRFEIFTISVQGGEPQQLTSGFGDSIDPCWSPDGRYLIFSSNRRGRYHLYVMQATGENQQRLTASGGDDTNPSWSPRLE
jgi:TolB protein